MALMCQGCNKLQYRLKFSQLHENLETTRINLASHSAVSITATFEYHNKIDEYKLKNTHAQKGRWFHLSKEVSGMIFAFYTADPDGKIQFPACRT